MFYWSFTPLVHFWPPQFLILATPVCRQTVDNNIAHNFCSFQRHVAVKLVAKLKHSLPCKV